MEVWLAVLGAASAALANLGYWVSESTTMFVAGGSDDMPDAFLAVTFAVMAVAPVLSGAVVGLLAGPSMNSRIARGSLGAGITALLLFVPVLVIQVLAPVPLYL